MKNLWYKFINYCRLIINYFWTAKPFDSYKYLKEDRERLVETMAPPMKAKFLGGEIQFRNIPKDKVDMVREYLKKLEANKPVEMENVIPLPAPVGVMPDTALGISKNSDGQYVVVVVKYNHSSNEAIVEELISAGNHKSLAEGKFKIICVEKNLI